MCQRLAPDLDGVVQRQGAAHGLVEGLSSNVRFSNGMESVLVGPPV